MFALSTTTNQPIRLHNPLRPLRSLREKKEEYAEELLQILWQWREELQ